MITMINFDFDFIDYDRSDCDNGKICDDNNFNFQISLIHKTKTYKDIYQSINQSNKQSSYPQYYNYQE